MRLKWADYWYNFSASILKHIGTALAGWGGVNIASTQGIDVPKLDWRSLGIFIVAAGIVPALASFWSRTPLPEREETKKTVTTTEVTETTKPDKT